MTAGLDLLAELALGERCAALESNLRDHDFGALSDLEGDAPAPGALLHGGNGLDLRLRISRLLILGLNGL